MPRWGRKAAPAILKLPKILGPLRDPFAAQGRSYRVQGCKLAQIADSKEISLGFGKFLNRLVKKIVRIAAKFPAKLDFSYRCKQNLPRPPFQSLPASIRPLVQTLATR
ncbi:hypothetical protein [Pseudomonas sichuanensis]|uniref:hypothetical protein n=1 Tax=Pseudomonas sichuanensis TaxID=2213015 RepID=UPI001300BD3A|nr:hypothetical protein [Pseudomonas sichuanensis]